MRTVREFDTVGDRYLINGIDLAEAIFFSRAPQGMYEPIPKGSYRIVNEGGNTYLEVIDNVLLAKSEKFQVVYQFASMSSTYEVDFNVDVDTLKNRYNEVVKDVKAIFAYVKSNMMTADGEDVSVILPELGNGEVWMRTPDGYKGFNVSDIELNIKNFWEDFNKKTAEILKQIELEGSKQIDRVEDSGDIKLVELDLKANEIDDKLDLIWRMYSVITGSNRFLSGGSIVDRDITKLERSVDGGLILGRVPDNQGRVYSGGNIMNRAIVIPKTMDLGMYKEIL